MAKSSKNNRNVNAPAKGKLSVAVDNTPKADTAPASSGEPPQSALYARVIAYCDSIRDLTTTKLHALAVECLRHGAPEDMGGTGDLRPLVALQNNLPNSIRKLALANWAAAFAPITWGKKDAKDNIEKCYYAKAGDKGFGKPWNLDGAESVPFYDAPEAEKPKGLSDTLKMLMQRRDGYQKLLDDKSIVRKDDVTDDKITQEIARLNTAIRALNAA